MACDICGAKGTPLNGLQDGYKTADIQQICPACEKVINGHVWKIRGMLEGVLRTLMKRFMAERRAGVCGVEGMGGIDRAQVIGQQARDAYEREFQADSRDPSQAQRLDVYLRGYIAAGVEGRKP